MSRTIDAQKTIVISSVGPNGTWDTIFLPCTSFMKSGVPSRTWTATEFKESPIKGSVAPSRTRDTICLICTSFLKGYVPRRTIGALYAMVSLTV